VVSEIAQLIKLIDYVTRYEWDTFRYPSQYIRIKKDNWNKLYHLWQTPPQSTKVEITLPAEKRTKFVKWKRKFTKNAGLQTEIKETTNELPKTEVALKQYFLDKLLNFQFKWATSTISDQSVMHHRYKDDQTLKYFLQRFLDTFLLMYYPVFYIQKTPIDAEIIFISPIGIEIIYIIEETPPSVIVTSDGRTWTIEKEKQQTKILNPLIALKRTEQIVNSILSKQEINFPVQKVVLSRTNSIVFSTAPYNTKLIDKSAYEDWFQEKRKLALPLKNTQLKAAEALLRYCVTNSFKRAE
jgi:hypothetical protein